MTTLIFRDYRCRGLVAGFRVGVYQLDAGLPPGIRATANVNGTAFTVICNEVGPGTFMSY